MARRAKGLIDVTIRAFIAKRKRGEGSPRLADSGGLRLVMAKPDASALWQTRYRWAGRERIASLGAYPGVTLEEARASRDAIKKALREGRDLSAEKRHAKAARQFFADATFGSISSAWIERQKADWSPVYYGRSKRAIERDVLPSLGKVPVNDITSLMVLRVIDAITQRGARETASRVLEHVAAVFDHAKVLGLLVGDNPAGPVRKALPKKAPERHHPALHDIDAIRDLLRRIDAAPLSPAVRMAHRLVAHSAQRVGNVLSATWSEFELETDVAAWIIPRSKMKVKGRQFDHLVVLGPTIAAALRDWKRITAPSTSSALLFASPVATLGLPKAVTLEAMSKYEAHARHARQTSCPRLARKLLNGRE